MGKKILRAYLAKNDTPSSEAYAKLGLPASPWELWDAMEKVRLQTDDILYMEIEDYYDFEYLANETTVPEELYEYMDLDALGCRYEDEHPGVFIGSDYVCYPAEEQNLTMKMQ